MTVQLDLFLGRPLPPPRRPLALARSSDPSTSHAAAEAISGALSRLEGEILAVLRRAGVTGCTLDEICTATGLEKVTASPRLKPLEDKGMARRTGKTRRGKSGRAQGVLVAI